MKIKIKTSTVSEFPCLMESSLGQILLVSIALDVNENKEYIFTVLANLDNSMIGIGNSWVRQTVVGYTFLPTGYELTITN